MKKIIAVLLSALMIFSVMGVAYAAEIQEVEVTGQCTHEHKDAAPCHCCLFCPNIDISYLTTCAKNQGDGMKYDGSLCCAECTGIFPCNCGCSCCAESQDKDDDGNKLDDLITDADKDSFVAGFQSILKVISDWFDKIFDAIFEFLRFDEVVK